MMNNYNKLKVQKIIKTYNKRNVVNGVSLEVNRGEIIGLLGPNGAGKTTTFYMITGMIKPNKGNIFLDEKNITKLPMYKRALSGLGYLSQEPSVFTKLTVENNLKLVLELTNLSKKQQLEKLEELLDEFSIGHIRNSIAYTLSGGERRRTEIARCLCSNPSIILMDEPTAGVDPIGIDDIKVLIKQLMNKNIGVLITDHNVREVLDICDYSYVMHSGEIIAKGESDIILGNKEARKFYLGDSFKY